MIFSLWHCGHSIAFSFALPLFSHTSNSLTSAIGAMASSRHFVHYIRRKHNGIQLLLLRC